MTQAPGYVGLPLQITVASPQPRGVTGISVTASAAGYSAATTVGACSASGCNIVAQAPPGYVRVQVSLTDANLASVISGEFHAEADEAGAPVPVSFGGSPASVDLSVEPAEFKARATATATLRAIAYDAQGRRIIGSSPFPSPIAVSSSSSSAQLSGSSLTSPNDTIAVTFDGTGSGDVTFSGAVSGAAVESVQVPIAVSDTADLNGEH